MINNRTNVQQFIQDKLVVPGQRQVLLPDEGEAYIAGWHRRKSGIIYYPDEHTWDWADNPLGMAWQWIQGISQALGRCSGLENDDIIVDVRTRSPYGSKVMPGIPLNLNNISSTKSSQIRDDLQHGASIQVKLIFDGGNAREAVPVSWRVSHPPSQHLNAALVAAGLGDTTSPAPVSAAGTTANGLAPLSSYVKGSTIVAGGTGLRVDPSSPLFKLVADIVTAGRTYNVDPTLIAAICMQESGGHPQAYNNHSGATGLCQFEPATWNGIPLGTGVNAQTIKTAPRPLSTNIWDPINQIYACGFYLSSLYQEFSNWRTAVGAYNAGPHTALIWKGLGYAVPQVPETIKYVHDVCDANGWWARIQKRTAELSKSLYDRKPEFSTTDKSGASIQTGLIAMHGGGGVAGGGSALSGLYPGGIGR